MVGGTHFSTPCRRGQYKTRLFWDTIAEHNPIFWQLRFLTASCLQHKPTRIDVCSTYNETVPELPLTVSNPWMSPDGFRHLKTGHHGMPWRFWGYEWHWQPRQRRHGLSKILGCTCCWDSWIVLDANMLFHPFLQQLSPCFLWQLVKYSREISIHCIALPLPFPPCQGFVKLMAKLLDFRSYGSQELRTNFFVFPNAIMTIVKPTSQ